MRALRFIIVLAVLAACITFGGGASEAFEGYTVHASLGLFIPGSDYEPVNGEDWGTGPDFGISIGKNFTDVLGFEIGMHGYSADAGEGATSAEVSAVGLEALITVQPTAEKLQPFAGVGIGFYSSTVTHKTGGGKTETEYDGAGAVIKAGVRYQFSDRYMAGAFVRAFGNNAEPDNGGDEIDLGGASTNLEVSIVF